MMISFAAQSLTLSLKFHYVETHRAQKFESDTIYNIHANDVTSFFSEQRMIVMLLSSNNTISRNSRL